MLFSLDAIRRDVERRLVAEEQDRITRYVGHRCGDICAGERDQGGPVVLGRPVDQTAAAAVLCRCGGVMRAGTIHYCRGRA